MGEMMFAAGALWVAPGIPGWDTRVEDPRRLADLETQGPTDPRAYPAAVTHMFGTCRMGSDPAITVVDPSFRHHDAQGLFVADSSVFPTNTGVNPQTSIIAMARLCATAITQAS